MFTYVGNCAWRLIKSMPHQIADGIPGQRDTWFGREDFLAAFRGTYPLYATYAGGYITAVDPNDDQGPFSTCDLTITLPPDFGRVLLRPDLSIKTATASASVVGSSAIPNDLVPAGQTVPTTVTCQRSVSFYSPATRYAYFANTKPDGPRYGSSATTLAPVVIRSVITVQAPWGTLSFSGNAPAAVVSALFMPTIDKLQSFEAEQIPGTPWYQCVDVIGREFQGD